MRQGIEQFGMVYEIQLQKENDDKDIKLADELKKSEENI